MLRTLQLKACAACACGPLNLCFSLSLPILKDSTQQGTIEVQTQDKNQGDRSKMKHFA